MKKVIYTDNAPAPIGPYNQAILAGDTLYVSGQIAIDPKSGHMIVSSIQEETKQVLENLKAVIEAGGMSMSNIVKCSIFIADMNQFQEINEVYAGYFSHDPPARETVEVACLPKNVSIEISAIACF